MTVLMFPKVILSIVQKMYIDLKIVEDVKMLFLQMGVQILNIFLLVKEVQIVHIVVE